MGLVCGQTAQGPIAILLAELTHLSRKSLLSIDKTETKRCVRTDEPSGLGPHM